MNAVPKPRVGQDAAAPKGWWRTHRLAAGCAGSRRLGILAAVPGSGPGRAVDRQGQPVVEPDAGRAAADRPVRAGAGAGGAALADRVGAARRGDRRRLLPAGGRPGLLRLGLPGQPRHRRGELAAPALQPERWARASPRLRHWLLAAMLLASALTGQLVWENVNPVSLTHRALIFGRRLAWARDAGGVPVRPAGGAARLVRPRLPGRCGLGLIGRASVVRVSARHAAAATTAPTATPSAPSRRSSRSR